MLTLNILGGPLCHTMLCKLPQEGLGLASNLQAVKKLCQSSSTGLDLHFSSPLAEHLQDPIVGYLLAHILGSL